MNKATAEPQRPFARGSISVGLHPIVGLDGREQAAAIVEQAQAAEAAGFSGVTLSEHHGGFPGYMGLPALASNWILGATERIWSAPAPYLVNLRNPILAAEELAWSAARFPGRFGAALAPGYAQSDFELLGVPWDEKRPASSGPWRSSCRPCGARARGRRTPPSAAGPPRRRR